MEVKVKFFSKDEYFIQPFKKRSWTWNIFEQGYYATQYGRKRGKRKRKIALKNRIFLIYTLKSYFFRRERNVVLQCVRYVCNKNFLQDSDSLQPVSTKHDPKPPIGSQDLNSLKPISHQDSDFSKPISLQDSDSVHPIRLQDSDSVHPISLQDSDSLQPMQDS